jgi:hypothetical protein
MSVAPAALPGEQAGAGPGLVRALRQLGGCDQSGRTRHLRRQVTYQPASRFWASQWYETAIFLAPALARAGFCVRWTRRRRLT